MAIVSSCSFTRSIFRRAGLVIAVNLRAIIAGSLADSHIHTFTRESRYRDSNRLRELGGTSVLDSTCQTGESEHSNQETNRSTSFSHTFFVDSSAPGKSPNIPM